MQYNYNRVLKGGKKAITGGNLFYVYILLVYIRKRKEIVIKTDLWPIRAYQIELISSEMNVAHLYTHTYISYTSLYACGANSIYVWPHKNAPFRVRVFLRERARFHSNFFTFRVLMRLRRSCGHRPNTTYNKNSTCVDAETITISSIHPSIHPTHVARRPPPSCTAKCKRHGMCATDTNNGAGKQ